MIADKLIAYTKQWVNYTEVKPNKGFTDPTFDKLMRTYTPFENGFAWCACFMILCWTWIYKDTVNLLPRLKKLFSANSQQMWRNFRDSEFTTSTTTPVLGAAVIFGDVGSTVSGHTAACIIDINPDGKHYTSVEGNVNDKVSIVNHVVGAPHPVTGLEFLGFIYPIELTETVDTIPTTTIAEVKAQIAYNAIKTDDAVIAPTQPSKLTQIVNLFKNYHMNLTGSWKTTMFGILVILPQAAAILFPRLLSGAQATALSALFGGLGLTASKDSNVTGGTVANPVNDSSVVCANTNVDSGLTEKTS